jgi:hypothetical protein
VDFNRLNRKHDERCPFLTKLLKDRIRVSRMSVIIGTLCNKVSGAMIIQTRIHRFKSNKQQIIIHTEM